MNGLTPKNIGLVIGPMLAGVMLLTGPPAGLGWMAWGTGALLVA